MAARAHEPRCVEALLRHGADARARDAGGDALTAALASAVGGETARIVKALAVHGIDLNAQAADGSTPLFRTARGGKTEAVKALLQAGADPNAPRAAAGPALMGAVLAHNDDCVDELVLHAVPDGPKRRIRQDGAAGTRGRGAGS